MKDFQRTRGMLVRYSQHYRNIHSEMDWSVVGKLIGVVIDTETFQENGVIVTYPVVAWEGGNQSMCHPDNVVPYRRGTVLPDLKGFG